jgi:hypothetical protein
MDRKIDLMIIGAQKAATTSMLRYLGEHPQCISHPQQEFSFYTDDDEFNEGWETALKKYYLHKSYHKETKIIAKNASLFTYEKGLQRLKEHSPNCEIIIILRNPVERCYSSYLMEKNYGSVKFEFSEIPNLLKKHEENDESWGFNFFINYGLYAQYLKNIYTYFPKEQVKILLFRDFNNNPVEECQNIFRKLGINSTFRPKVEIKHNITQKTRSQIYARLVRRFLRNGNPIKKIIKKIMPGEKAYKYGELLRDLNKTNNKNESMNDEVKLFLIEYYKPHNIELENIIGKDLSDWNI